MHAGQVQMPSMIMMIMLAAAGFIILFAKTTAAQVTKASLFSSAGQAAIAVFGVVWMSSTFMDHNYELIKEHSGRSGYTVSLAICPCTVYPEYFAFQPGCNHQSADATWAWPWECHLHFLIGIFPAVNGHFFIPGYPTLLTAIQFDRTGTTRIGKYVLNHSFMLPGLVTTIASVMAGLLLQSILM